MQSWGKEIHMHVANRYTDSCGTVQYCPSFVYQLQTVGGLAQESINNTVEPLSVDNITLWDPAYCPYLGLVERLSSFRGCFVQSLYTTVHLVCPLFRGLSSFGVSFIGGFTVIIAWIYIAIEIQNSRVYQ